MSARLFSIALELDVPSPAAKLIIAKMVDCCDDDGRRIFPSVATLARVGQCSDRQVQRYLRKFCGLGLLRVVREGGTGRRATTHYEIDLPTFHALAQPGAWAGLEQRAGEAVSIDDEACDGDKAGADEAASYANSKGDMVSPYPLRVTSEAVKGDTMMSPNPLKDPSEGKREGARALAGADTSHAGHAADARAGEAGNAEQGRPEPGPTLAEFRKAWGERVALDDRTRLENAWAELPFAERGRAVAAVPAFLRLVAESKRSCLPAASTYLHDRKWQDIDPARVAAAAPGQAGQAGEAALWTCAAWSRDWWAVLLARCEAGKPVSMMAERARGGKELTLGIAEKPGEAALAALKQHRGNSEHCEAWRRWLARRGAHIDRKPETTWVFLPAGPPPDG